MQHTVKGLVKVKNMLSAWSCLSKPLTRVSMRLVTPSNVDLFFLNQNWFGNIISKLSKNLRGLSEKVFSYTILIVGGRDWVIVANITCVTCLINRYNFGNFQHLWKNFILKCEVYQFCDRYNLTSWLMIAFSSQSDNTMWVAQFFWIQPLHNTSHLCLWHRT